MFGVEDHTDTLRRDGYLRAALRKYAEYHNEPNGFYYVSGELGFGGRRALEVPLKRGVYITLGNKWVFTFRPNIKSRKGIQMGLDSFVPKFAALPTIEPVNFEPLLSLCKNQGIPYYENQ